MKELKELFSLKAFHIGRRTEVEHCALEQFEVREVFHPPIHSFLRAGVVISGSK